MRRLPLFVALLATSAMAQAGEKPLYQPAPAWVKPAPAVDAAKLTGDAPVLLLFDNQQRLEDGRVWSYVESAARAASTEALGSIGTIQLQWQPSQGDLIVHRAEIIRGAEHIDLIKGGNPLTVLRREQGMEQRILDGRLTATMPVEGLRVGDVLHIAFSVTRRDPTLKGDMQAFAPLMFAPARVGFARVRLSWPAKSDLRWKSYVDGLTARPVVENGYNTLDVALPLPKQPDMPADAPTRFAKLPIVEASSFADWAAVSKVMAPLYATAGLITPGSPLAAEVARIRAAESDPLRRAALALQLVQEKVRYLLMGMDTGNYVPQSPTKTWEARYGDCKAKTLLLLAVLHELGIEAEPVLANSKLGDMVPTRLPGAAAFDHVFVRATVNGETLWLDGTGAGARLADIHDTPGLGYVLPVRASGAEPMRIDLRAPARPDIAVAMNYDQSAGIGLPAAFDATVTLKGPLAEMTRLAKAQGSKDDLDKLARSLIGSYEKNVKVVSQDISFDDAAGTARVAITGVAYPNWERENERWRLSLDRVVGAIDFSPDRARTAWKDIPVRTDGPSYIAISARLRLPRGAAGFVIDGTKADKATLGGNAIDRSVGQDGDWITVNDVAINTGAEIAAADIPAEKRRLSAAKANLPRAVAPADYPSSWEEIAAARRERRLEPILAIYARDIAARPDEREGYINRAWFLAKIYDRKAAIADLDKALALEPDAETYLKRGSLHAALGDDDKALADAVEANKLDPSDDGALMRLAYGRAERGEKDAAYDLVQERIDQGGKNRAAYMAAKADLQMRLGDKDGAIETMDSAIALKPGDADLLNSRCWLKGVGNVGMDSALKDCTRAIELADGASQALDSRAMVYFRMGRLDDALADLDAALAIDPDLVASLYMRGVIRRRAGKTKEGDADLAAARLLSPRIDRDYSRYGIVP
ncbi:MAG: hypothetical protein BGO24_10250 [Sphingomonas sp. 67-36]|uniref:DUF3857 domain-containing protein n=2 Tax=unclassified Sphingomonas TaxID=196159 RepID=UPI000928EDFB|nr:DUF3857 domain-containing protein [Sphingomonas sp.]MBN8846790.1 tetratricopeptide repeat protein [Sphingomonas sp.]OJV33808.1 MAG: hypothetical protein BGO24_10250 [Sphingomonas sp. 67-36]